MSLSSTERAALVVTLRSLTDDQWAAETLCAGWDAGDLVAHLIIREREPLTGPGIVLGGPVGAFTEMRRRTRAALPRERLIEQLAAGPTWWMSVGPLDGAQATEDWIHHADVRRGGAGLEPRDTRPEMRGALWAAATRFARVGLASAPAPGVVELTDGHDRLRLLIGAGKVARSTDAAAEATVSGQAGELALWAAGRDAARVEITGNAEVVESLEASSRGI